MYQFFGLALIYQWTSISVARRTGGHDPQFLELIDILCLEMRYPKQNSVIRLKSNIFAPQIVLAFLKFLGCLR